MAKIQVRRDTAANWTSANPTLSAGEIGFETNTGKLKVGDGSTAWNSLRYSGLPNVGISSMPQTGEVLKFDGTKWTNAADATGGDTLFAADGVDSVRRIGNNNSSGGTRSAALAGESNTAGGTNSVVVGGSSNVTYSENTAILGGAGNEATNYYASVVGGLSNIATEQHAFVGNGDYNKATGNRSLILGGTSNRTDRPYASVVGGLGNTAQADFSGVFGGQNNKATAVGSFVGVGTQNTASGKNSVIVAGESNTATGELSCVLGGKQAAANLYGEHAHASGGFNAAGEAQVRRFVLRNEYPGDGSNGGGISLYLDGEQRALLIPENASWNYSIKILGRDLSNYYTAAYNIDGVLERNDLTATILHETKTALIEDQPAWNITCAIETKKVVRLNLPDVQLVKTFNNNKDIGRPVIDISGDYEFIQGNWAGALFSNGKFWLVLLTDVIGYNQYFINCAVYLERPTDFTKNTIPATSPYDSSNVLLSFRVFTTGVPLEPLPPPTSPHDKNTGIASNFAACPAVFLTNGGFDTNRYQNAGAAVSGAPFANASQVFNAPYLNILAYASAEDKIRWTASVEALQVINPSVLIGYDYAYSS